MDRLAEYQFEVEHQHSDGSWSALAEDRSPHDPATVDPERRWFGRIFRCTSCGEVVRVASREGSPAPDAE